MKLSPIQVGILMTVLSILIIAVPNYNLESNKLKATTCGESVVYLASNAKDKELLISSEDTGAIKVVTVKASDMQPIIRVFTKKECEGLISLANQR